MLHTTTVCNHSFAPALLGPTSWVVDCGANHGDFAAWVSRNTQARVVSFEPDPRLFSALPQLERVTHHNLAVAGSDGKLTLHLGEHQCSSVHYREHEATPSVDVDAVQLDAFLDELDVGEIGLLKLDIEGAELDVVDGVDPAFWRRVRQITCEFHEFLDPASLPRVEEALRHLEALGFYWINFSRHNYGDVLLLNRRYVRIDAAQVAALHAEKYWRGAARLLERRLSQRSK